MVVVGLVTIQLNSTSLKRPLVPMGATTFDSCCNLSLGLMTKAMVCKGIAQKRSLGVTFHALRRLRVWESVRIEPPHSQVNSHFGSWSIDGLSNFQRTITRVKIHWIYDFFISLESSWNVDV
jgi:hypothetical protein